MHSTLMKKFLKLISLISLIVLFSFVTYQICYWTAERYFFDKFFFKKSVKHGYLFCDQDGCHLEKYGKRSEDIINLLSESDPGNQTAKVLGRRTEDTFTIAIIGDSFVWGVGVKNNERFSVLLEKKLNKIRKTKILSYGRPADNLAEHLAKMDLISKSSGPNINLYIFALIFNDILARQKQNYKNQLVEQIMEECSSVGEYIYKDYATYEKDNLPYHIWVDKAWKNEANLCVFKRCISYFPHNAIYFATTDYQSDNKYTGYEVYKDILQKNNFFILSADKGKEIKNYQKYWENFENFRVSEKEPHASKLAHQMYADILYQEIITNPRWKFIKNHDSHD